MSDNQPIKKYPLTTKEVADMLGIEHASEDLPLGSFSAKGKPPILDLPTADDNHQHDDHGTPAGDHKPDKHADTAKDEKPSDPAIIKLGKAALPYALIFTFA